MTDFLKKFDYAGVIVAVVFYVSPALAILCSLGKAIYSSYDQGLITDPGHRWVRFLNVIVALLAVGGIAFSFIQSTAFNPDNFIQPGSSPLYFIFFAQFSGFASFGVLYSLSTLLYFYSKYTEDLIRKINEAYKVW